jgi:hypothetical protein
MKYKIIKLGGGVYAILPKVYTGQPSELPLVGVYKSREEAQAKINAHATA